MRNKKYQEFLENFLEKYPRNNPLILLYLNKQLNEQRNLWIPTFDNLEKTESRLASSTTSHGRIIFAPTDSANGRTRLSKEAV
jgi:hypothetical protein